MSGAKVISDAREAAQELAERVRCAKRVVFFGGAGVSTASGIPDFRSEDGLYHQKFKYPPEEMLSHEFYLTHTEEFFDFYRTRMIALGAKPNQAHYKLAELEREGKLTAVVTQNIDGLHQAAGSRRVWELHGSVLRNRCMSCGRPWPVSAVAESAGVPRCTCGGVIKPDVVLYEESLEAQVLEGALEDIRQADLLIIGGTSLVVYPAAGLVNYYRGDRLALINKSPTPYDRKADLVLTGSIGEILGQIQVR